MWQQRGDHLLEGRFQPSRDSSAVELALEELRLDEDRALTIAEGSSLELLGSFESPSVEHATFYSLRSGTQYVEIETTTYEPSAVSATSRTRSAPSP